jgi:hypothetical protein
LNGKSVVNSELGGIWKATVVTQVKDCFGICLEGLEKATWNIGQKVGDLGEI